MGKPTGFKEFKRENLAVQSVEERIRHYREFEYTYSDEVAKIQAARCMDCGIPFCHGDTGCPVDNLIPEFNDLVWRGHLREALENLHSTNNFPEFTGRLCPAPCESACVLGINEPPVSIKGVERYIIDKGFEMGWVRPRPPRELSGKTVAIVGSGPAGLACAQQLARLGHKVTVYEKNDRIGGLLRYGIPDFKLEKWIIDRRLEQMKAEGVVFHVGVHVGKTVSVEELLAKFDAIVLAGGAEEPRDLPIPGRNLKNIHFAMEFLVRTNKKVAGDPVPDFISAKDKHVVVIGGGDTGSDCVGTANRHGAKSVTQLEIFPMPPKERSPLTPWPFWPMKLRTSTSHEEGCERMWSVNTIAFKDNGKGEVGALQCVRVELQDGRFVNIPGSEFEIKADLVLLAMGFLHPTKEGLLTQLAEMGLEFDARGNVKAQYGDEPHCHRTNLEKIFVAGDMRRGQSLIVWAIAEGRKAAQSVHHYLSQKVKTW
ncbi:MAG: glutamate synthase subunit beta [Leptospiraceae bacterium]|nr:glutamate synthase subunit beta [Leptospiraceae bacterium]MDW8305509.1 glutamate synthase subunit beta [Leptospiraceae bacterium]